MARDVTVVIACYTEQRWTSLLAAVASVRAQRYPHRLVVVVDHNEQLLSRLQRERPGVTIMRNTGLRGASGARNSAALAATTEFVAFLDDDARAAPGWLERLVAAADQPGVVGAGGHIDPAWRCRPPQWFPREFGWVVGVSLPSSGTISPIPTRPLPRRVRNVWSGSMIVDREVFARVGGFRDDFGKLGTANEPEDTELCLRMASTAPDAHWVFVPDAVIHHEVPPERATLRYFVKRCWNEGTGKASLARLPDGRADSLSAERSYVQRVLPRGVARYLGQVLRGDLSGAGRAAAVITGLLTTALGFALGTARRADRTASGAQSDLTDHQGGPSAAPGHALPILMYHSVPAQAPSPRDPLRVPLAELRDHVQTLQGDGWELLGLTEALATLKQDPARRVVALTFDDGYADFLGAADVLEEVGARATLYVSTATVDGTSGYGRMVSWPELASLPARGIEIGSHAHHHRPIDVLPGAELREELITSRDELEQRLGVTLTSFCFPNGYTSRRVKRALVAAGYANACIVGRRVATVHSDRYALPRLQVRPGVGADELRRLIAHGEPGLAPRTKRALHPAWRVVRWISLRLLQRELT
jgi:peptidoglycan/xylan/chitin deacetylase (PgdA/CDA1 family)/GT2 family glycosyltransferase